jgi:heme exporter protein A
VTLETSPLDLTPAFTLSVRALCCEREYRVLFDQLTFDVKNHDLVRVAGSNGAGKSTLLRALVGLNTDVDGHIHWNQRPIDKAQDYHAKLLYIGHQPGVKAELTAVENLRWLSQCACSDASAPSQRVLLEALDQLDLLPFADTLAGQLSAGQKRRIALARLWLDTSPLWVLDEPFTAIDVTGITSITTKITEHAQAGGAVVLTTHQMPNFHYPLTTLNLNEALALSVVGNQSSAFVSNPAQPSISVSSTLQERPL